MKTVEHQTVGWWIEQLKEFPADKPVILFTGFQKTPDFMLSIYESEDKSAVFIDIGDEDSDA